MLGIVTAVATLAGGYFGYQASQSNKDASAANSKAADANKSAALARLSVSAASSAAASNATVVSTLQVDNTSLAQRAASADQALSSLQAALSSQASAASLLASKLDAQTTAPNSDGAPASAASGTTGQIRHQQNGFIIALSKGIDLDARKDDLQWVGSRNKDLLNGYSEPGTVSSDTNSGIEWVYIGPTKPDYNACYSKSPYADFTPIALDDVIHKNDFICVLTDEGRYSAVQYVSRTDAAATFNITTYEK